VRGGGNVERRLAEVLGDALRRAVAGIGGKYAHPVAERRLHHFAEYPPLQIDRDEQVGVGDEHLRLAQQQQPLVIECEMKAAEDLRLRLGGEVHQRVAAHEQVDPRDRRILDEVVAPEDHPAPQVLAKDVALVGALEEPVQGVARDVFELARLVGPVPRLVQRLLVDVGGVDLDSVAERGVPEHAGEHHGDGVRLLPRGRASAPDAQRRVVRAGVDEARQYLGGEVLPRLGVAEEARDVDEQRVEQLDEFLAVQL
jgi:hypothetical protein